MAPRGAAAPRFRLGIAVGDVVVAESDRARGCRLKTIAEPMQVRDWSPGGG